MATLARGDIVLFPFPYTDLSDRKLRPCLVLSEEMGEDIMLCQITSQRLRKDEYSVELKPADTTDGTIMIDSYIRANMIFTASKAQIRRKLCKAKDEKYRQVTNAIAKIIVK
ncbi:type II toxin-antitoxin system PemK/MazF family toxin [Candidatus Woesearchaeota archaeon]|nr:type II toxin-antitoxin system PemK/MazF family toxin [Candidatus Woesearchaeota archaeon]